MGEVTTIGLDIAKSVFQVHGVDADGQVVLRQRLTRARVLPFFAQAAGTAGSASRPAPRRITGRGSCRRSATTCG